jgi:hypothetical protein
MRGEYSRWDRVELRALSRVARILRPIFAGHPWLRSVAAATVVSIAVVLDPIEAAVEGIGRVLSDGEASGERSMEDVAGDEPAL